MGGKTFLRYLCLILIVLFNLSISAEGGEDEFYSRIRINPIKGNPQRHPPDREFSQAKCVEHIGKWRPIISSDAAGNAVAPEKTFKLRFYAENIRIFNNLDGEDELGELIPHGEGIHALLVVRIPPSLEVYCP